MEKYIIKLFMVEQIFTQNNNAVDKIPFKQRNLFQAYLMNMMDVKRGEHNLQEKWTNKNAGRISEIIDDTSNKNYEIIKDLITNEKYDEASKYVLEELDREIYH